MTPVNVVGQILVDRPKAQTSGTNPDVTVLALHGINIVMLPFSYEEAVTPGSICGLPISAASGKDVIDQAAVAASPLLDRHEFDGTRYLHWYVYGSEAHSAKLMGCFGESTVARMPAAETGTWFQVFRPALQKASPQENAIAKRLFGTTERLGLAPVSEFVALVHSLIRVGDWGVLNAAITEPPIENVSVELGAAFLRTTFRWKTKIDAWAGFRDSLGSEIKRRGMSSTILRGLS